MLKARLILIMLAGGLLALCCAGSVRAAGPTVADILKFKPRQLGVDCSSPKPEEVANCKLDLERSGKLSGYVLRDPQGKLLRRFFDTLGDGKIHAWSYYKDGVEVYREIDSDGNARPDQYRWMNAAGTRWGLDPRETGIIDEWKVISPEEVCQELLLALTTRDFNRVKTLMITDAEIKKLNMSEAETKRLRDLRGNAADKFKATLLKTVALNDKTHILNFDIAAPQCIVADQPNVGEVVKHLNIGMACGTGEKDSSTLWIQTGELIQFGSAWRLVDAPREGMPEFADTRPEAGGILPDEIQNLVKELDQYDAGHHLVDNPTPKEMIDYHLRRVEIVQKFIDHPKCPPDEKIKRIQEMADGLSAAAQSGEKSAYDSLQRLQKSVLESKIGGDALAAFVSYRELQTRYAMDLGSGKSLEEVQKTWVERLAKFVQSYPRAAETPEALKELGLASEFLGKEIDAKNWYLELVKSFESHAYADLARGAIRRIESEGKTFELSGQKLTGGGQFDISDLKGKIVLVYYWASWNQQCVGDFARLKLLLDSNSSKGVELVCVNLDNSVKEAQAFMSKTPTPGIHVCLPDPQATGLQSKLAIQYGIQVLPHMFIVGKDGKVVNRSGQVATVADELAKLLK